MNTLFEARKDELIDYLLAHNYKKHGDWLNGTCPNVEAHTHGDKNPSYGVNVKTGTGRCFVCGKYSFRETLKLHGFTVEIGERLTPPRAKKQKELPPLERPDAAWQRSAAAFVEMAVHQLWGDCPEPPQPKGQWTAKKTLDYLHKQRGMTDEMIRRAKIGFATAEQLAPRYGLYQPDEPFPRLIIPWFDETGLFAVNGRILADEEKLKKAEKIKKYRHFQHGKPSAGVYDASWILGIQTTADSDVLLSEGELAALVGAQSLAFDNVNSRTRGPAMAGYLPQLRAELKNRTVILALDSDAAGQRGRDKMHKDLANVENGTLKANTWPDGCKDLDEAVLAGHSLIDILKQAKPLNAPAPKPRKVARTLGSVYSAMADAIENETPLTRLTDAMRAGLIAYLPDAAAPVAELYCKGLQAGLLHETGRVNRSELFAVGPQLGMPLSRATIEKGTNSAAFRCFAYRDQEDNIEGKTAKCLYFCLTAESVTDAIESASKPQLIAKRLPKTAKTFATLDYNAKAVDVHDLADAETGDDAQLMADFLANNEEYADKIEYALEEYKRLERALGESIGTTPLPDGWTIRNKADHRAAFARCQIGRKPGIYSDTILSRMIGVSKRGLATVLAQAGIDSIKRGDENYRPTREFLVNMEKRFARYRPSVARFCRELDDRRGGFLLYIYVNTARYIPVGPRTPESERGAATITPTELLARFDRGDEVVLEYEYAKMRVIGKQGIGPFPVEKKRASQREVDRVFGVMPDERDDSKDEPPAPTPPKVTRATGGGKRIAPRPFYGTMEHLIAIVNLASAKQWKAEQIKQAELAAKGAIEMPKPKAEPPPVKQPEAPAIAEPQARGVPDLVDSDATEFWTMERMIAVSQSEYAKPYTGNDWKRQERYAEAMT